MHMVLGIIALVALTIAYSLSPLNKSHEMRFKVHNGGCGGRWTCKHRVGCNKVIPKDAEYILCARYEE